MSLKASAQLSSRPFGGIRLLVSFAELQRGEVDVQRRLHGEKGERGTPEGGGRRAGLVRVDDVFDIIAKQNEKWVGMVDHFRQ